jgi:hypothetical protein
MAFLRYFIYINGSFFEVLCVFVQILSIFPHSLIFSPFFLKNCPFSSNFPHFHSNFAHFHPNFPYFPPIFPIKFPQVTLVLFLYIHYSSPVAGWGDVSQALIFHQVGGGNLAFYGSNILFGSLIINWNVLIGSLQTW